MKRTQYKPTPHDWMEDKRPGRGLYHHMCPACRKTFQGHKARRICRVCETAPSVHIQGWRDMPKETQDALVRMFQVIADNWQGGKNASP